MNLATFALNNPVLAQIATWLFAFAVMVLSFAGVVA